MTSVGDSFAWPFQDPGWFGKMIIQGLIGIIPIVGWIAMVGWFLLILDNYRAGRRELPPAGFHLERGIGLFVVFLVYVIVFSLPGALLTGIGHRDRRLADLRGPAHRRIGRDPVLRRIAVHDPLQRGDHGGNRGVVRTRNRRRPGAIRSRSPDHDLASTSRLRGPATDQLLATAQEFRRFVVYSFSGTTTLEATWQQYIAETSSQRS